MNRRKLYRRLTGLAAMLALTLVTTVGSVIALPLPGPTLTTPTTTNLGTNQVTLNLKSNATGTGYFTLLSGSGTACGTGAQVKLGQTAGGVTAPYHGSLPLIAATAGAYTLRNLTQSTAYTVCYTADDVTTLQTTPVTANVATTMAAIIIPVWSTVGGAHISSGQADYLSVTFAPDGTPYMAYEDGANGGVPVVMKYTGSAWSMVGGAALSASQAAFTSVSFAPDGTPYVAFADASIDGIAKATVMKYTGSAWSTVGNAKFSTGMSMMLSISFAPDGAPYVAYMDYSGSNKATVMKYNGSVWSMVGSGGVSTSYIYSLSLSFAPDGAPYVAYTDLANNSMVTVMKYTGSTWTQVGGALGVSAGSIFGGLASLSFAPDGAPYVAYLDVGNGNKATVMKYAGSVWSTVGSAGLSSDVVGALSLKIAPDGTPYLAYRDGTAGTDPASTGTAPVSPSGNSGKATVMICTGVPCAWSAVGSAGITSGQALYTSLAFAPDGVPYLAYSAYDPYAPDNSVTPPVPLVLVGQATMLKMVQLAATTTTISSNRNPATLGSSITFTGTVVPSAATGTVTFMDGATPLGTAVTLAGGSATYSSTALIVGSHSMTAVYGGDGSYGGSTSSALTQTVNKASQTITFNNPNAQIYGTTPTLTASASSLLTPTFTSSTPLVCTITAGGLLTFVAPGNCTINADQAGSSSYLPAPQAPQTFIVGKGTPVVTVTPGTYTYSGSAQGPGATETTKGGSTGSLTFSYLGTGATSYTASSTKPTTAGTYTATATVTTDTNYNAGSSSATAFTIAKATPVVTVTPGIYTYSGSAQGPGATETTKGNSTGSLSFSYLGTGATTYTASSTKPTTAGTYTATATVTSDTNYNSASSIVTAFTIAKATQTTAVTVTGPVSVIYGTTGTVTAGGGNGTGGYSFSATGSTGCAVSGATLSVTSVGGSCNLTATRDADDNYNASTTGASYPVTLNKAAQSTVTLTGVPATAAVGDTFTAIATGGSGTGLYSYTFNGTACTVDFATGVGAIIHVTGGCSVTAARASDLNYNVSADSVPAAITTITRAAAGVSVWPTASAITYGRTLADSSLIGGVSVPAGAFTFTTPLTTPNAGTSSQNVTFTPTNTIDYSAVSFTVSVLVNKADPIIAFNSLPVTVGGSGIVSATGGSGSFTFGAVSTADCAVSGATVTGLKAGVANCVITADQAASANYNAATLTQGFSIGQGSQIITFGPSPTLVVGGNGTVSASAGSGLVVTYATTTPDVCTLSGVNNSTATGVKGGICTITAAQPGNSNFSAAPAAAQSFTVALGNQTITFGAAPNLETDGTATVTATGGRSGNPVLFSSLTPTTCSVSGTNGSTVTGLTPGACAISANQAGVAGYYNAAGQTTQNLIVTPKNQVSVVIQTNPSGLNFTVTDSDGVNSYVAPHAFAWVPGSLHTVTAPPTQPGITGVRYLFTNWSDGGAVTHVVTAPVAGASYTAAFATQYQLTTTTDGHGAAFPPQQWYNAGEYATILATPAAGYVFSAWTLTGGTGLITNPAAATTSVVMNGPVGINGAMLLLAPANLSASIVSGNKSGIIGGIRSWPISIQNTGNAAADGVTLNSVTLSTSGACKPTVTTDSLLPLTYGSIAGPGVVTQNIQVNFAKCPSLTKFTVTVRYGAANGVNGSNVFTGVTQ